MIRILSKSPDAASPRMLLISAGLHALFLCAIILVSFSVARLPAPREEIVSRVTLVDAEPGPPAVEQVRSDPIKAPAILPTHKVEPQTNTKDVPEPARQMLEPVTISHSQNEAIPLRKRRKPTETVEKPKKPEPKKPPESVAKKKEDPQKFLENRLASIRDKVEHRKSDASPPPAAPTDSQSLGKSGTANGGNAADEKLQQWLEGVRNRINSRWSVFGDRRQVRRMTVIGVTMDDNGRLVDAAVNESSGDEVFDQSALRAVFQADPFPAIPPEVREKIRTAGGLALRFAPGGMQ
jgi:protein TonB